jgi:hypothetical protein
MTLRRGLSLVAVLLLVAVAAPACSSSSKSDGAAGSQDTNADTGACPFSGSTQPQSEPGASGSASTTLTGATPQTDGCIDNVQLKFSPTLAASHFAYESGAPVLVVTLTGAQLGGGLSAGTTQNPKNLNNVQKIVVSAASGDVKVEITLASKRPFLVSSSQVPAELELSIG